MQSRKLHTCIGFSAILCLVQLQCSRWLCCNAYLVQQWHTASFLSCCSEWSATIESNIVNKGYSFTLQQYYSLSQNKVRVDLHSNGTDRVLIQVKPVGCDFDALWTCCKQHLPLPQSEQFRAQCFQQRFCLLLFCMVTFCVLPGLIEHMYTTMCHLQDFGANTLTVLTEANATYPHGYCSAQ